jgi:hypothetical protein
MTGVANLLTDLRNLIKDHLPSKNQEAQDLLMKLTMLLNRAEPTFQYATTCAGTLSGWTWTNLRLPTSWRKATPSNAACLPTTGSPSRRCQHHLASHYRPGVEAPQPRHSISAMSSPASSASASPTELFF